MDGNRGLLLRTSRWGKTYCSDSALNYPGSTLTSKSYLDTMALTALSFSNPSITVVGINAQTVQTDVCDYDPCFVAGGYGPTLCGRSAPVLPSISVDSISNCSDSTFFAVSTGTEIYNYYRDSISNTFDSLYRSFAMASYKYEKFTVSHTKAEYHYTLYYYDQAGNLLKTIPPAGVDLSKFGWDQAWSDSVTAARKNNQLLVPTHWLFTNYRYNSLNQVVRQKTPDAGTSQFWYDRLGRLSFSQNLKQYSISPSETGRQYSYTLYDVLGRITEVGQIDNLGTLAMADSVSRSQSLLNSWLSSSAAGKEQITQTVYDLPYAGFVGVTPQPMTQRNLRNRVSYTSFSSGNNPANYDQASFYTYDIEGNVDTLLQDYGSSGTNANVMNVNNNRWKKTVYQFDLISGKVNTVAYQAGKPDQFYHRYSYDGENRLILAETSSDSVTWEKEARYQYYKHGPLARMVIGDQQVQGLDYAYTLQGWLKGVNSTNLAFGYDMGRDGDTTYMNRYVARDAFGFNLGYYTGDYSPIKPGVAPFLGYSGLIGAGYKSLYNGNISSMAVNIGKFNNPLLYMYTYDQLNRLTAMDVDSGLNQSTNSWSPISIQDYQERVAYDPNGNITQYQRKGTNTVNLTMDSLSYFYNKANGKLINNQLNYIRDEIGGSTAYSTNYPNDIDDQSANNYAYDSIGNLVKDNAEGITNVSWNVYGKILEIQRTASGSNPTTNIQYTYDATGNRISKKVTDNVGNITYTWYSRDAQGNIMSTYTGTGSGTMDSTHYSLLLTEQHFYGSSRLGILSRSQTMKGSFTFPSIVTFQRGFKNYELANHLGSVLVTISDKKTGFSTNGTTVDDYTADVRNAADYYPFGMQIPARTYIASSNYRYGFNGQEKDNDIKGQGNSYTALNWEYDARSGRRWNLDPVRKPWQSSYTVLSNSPIWRVDPLGDDDYFNSEGRLIARTKTGSNIFIQSDKGNVLLTQLSLSNAHNRQAVANVVGYYATLVGVTYQGKGANENIGKGIVGLKQGTKDASENEAFTIGKDIYVNKKDNKINGQLYDFYNLENVLIHEKGHKIDKENNIQSNLKTHARVYLNAIEDATFRNGTKDYQLGTVGAFSNYLLNFYSNFANNSTDELYKFIHEFNQKNNSGFKVVPSLNSLYEKEFKMEIYKNNKHVGTTNYKKVSNGGGE